MSHDTQIFVGFVGLDVHKDTIAAACVGLHPDEPVIDLGVCGPQQYAIDRLLKKASGRGRIRVVYEAGPTGYGLQRYLASRDIDCVVAAPSLIPKAPGDRIKTDRRDAIGLALALRAGVLSPVRIPSVDEEAFRGVVRAWQQSKTDVTHARQRLKQCLLRNDIRYAGRATWGPAHRRWLSELVLPSAALQIVFQEHLMAIDERERRRHRLEAELTALTATAPQQQLILNLQALRGVSRVVATTLAAETGDLHRFATPAQFMAWLGLVPSEHSSGATRRQGAITRCGNRWARTMLVEAAWAYRYPAKVSRVIQLRHEGLEPEIVERAWAAQLRLCRRFQRLKAKHKPINKVVVAIARELAGFVWDIGQRTPTARMR